MPTGYPDYERLARSGGFLLYNASGNLPQLTTLWSGYVGNFPYLNIVINCNSSTDFIQVRTEYYSDSTLTTLVGFRYALRTGSNFSIVQYANISEWAKVSFASQSGNAFPFISFTVFGAQGPAGQIAVSSTDAPIIDNNALIPATTTQTFFNSHVQPGAATFMVQTAATAWNINISRYDWTTNSYLLRMQLSNAIAVQGGMFDLPMLDAPYKFDIHNSDAAARAFLFMWQSK